LLTVTLCHPRNRSTTTQAESHEHVCSWPRPRTLLTNTFWQERARSTTTQAERHDLSADRWRRPQPTGWRHATHLVACQQR
jgi:hypothetical protein